MVQGWAWSCPSTLSSCSRDRLCCAPQGHTVPRPAANGCGYPEQQKAQQKAAFPQHLNHLVLAQKNKQVQAAA